jgi:transposase
VKRREFIPLLGCSAAWPLAARAHNRNQLRYPSDLTDEEWAFVAPLISPPKPGGNKRSVDIREVINGILYILSTGCRWRAIPKDLPPRSTLFDYLALWSGDGTLERINRTLYVEWSEQGGSVQAPFDQPNEAENTALLVRGDEVMNEA